MKKVLTTCPYCGTGCNYYLMVGDDGNLCGVLPTTEHPVSRGQLCIKGWNSYGFVQHPDRLTDPMIKKNGKFVKVSWEDAFKEIVDRLRALQDKNGKDVISFFASAKVSNEENYLMMKLARAVFGTNNVDHCARLCHASTVAGLAAVFGSGAMTNSIACVEQADVIYVTGSNTTEQHPMIGTRVMQAKKNGAKLIVADNRRIRLSRFADMHLRHKNGTDVALVNSMMHVIFKEKLHDAKFVEERTENFAELQKILEEFPPERGEQITGVPAEDIAKAARLFATSGKGMIIYSMGITQHSHGVDNVKTMAHLAMLTGNLGKDGVGVNPLRGQNNVQGACDMGALPNVFTGYQKVTEEEVRSKFAKAWKVQKLPDNIGQTVTTAVDAALEGKIKGLFIMGENPMMSDPDITHVKKALEKLDFLVVQDLFMTPTAAMAHVVLPGASYAEKDGTFTSTERRVQRIRKAVEPVGNCRPDWMILCGIASAAGYPHMSYKSVEGVMDEIRALTPSYAGISYDRIEKTGIQWPCPGLDHQGTPVLHRGKFTKGKATFSAINFRPSEELPDKEYPFLLSTGRLYVHFHTGTMTRRTQLLDRDERSAYVEISPNDAKSLGIRTGESVSVSTRRGEIRVNAKVSDIVPDGVIFTTFHFEEAAANLLTNNALDPIAKIPEYKVCAARIRKIPQGGDSCAF